MKKRHALIVANAPGRFQIEIPDKYLHGTPILVALDGAINRWPSAIAGPDFWLGDFDSCVFKKSPRATKKIALQDQSKTDLD